MEKHLNLMN
jgi:predicted transcriptional regulator